MDWKVDHRISTSSLCIATTMIHIKLSTDYFLSMHKKDISMYHHYHSIFVINNARPLYLTIARKGWSTSSVMGSTGFQTPESGLTEAPVRRLFVASIIRFNQRTCRMRLYVPRIQIHMYMWNVQERYSCDEV